MEQERHPHQKPQHEDKGDQSADILDATLPEKVSARNSSRIPKRTRHAGKNQHSAERSEAKKKEVQAVADKALQRLENELKSGKSESLTRFLKTMAQFHSYSFRNQVLILAQREDATQVAGFGKWKSLGRHVAKGERGIRIFAPVTYKRKSEQEPAAPSDDETSPQSRLVGFRVVSVFDISQTEGEPLPGIGKVKGDPCESLSQLRELFERNGIELSYENLSGAEGVSRGGSVIIQSGLDSAKEFSVLAHELAHEIMHKGDLRKNTTRNQRELEAEAVAFVVGQAFGVESSNHSRDYIQLYQGDTDSLHESLDVIRRASASIIHELNQSPVKSDAAKST